MKKSNKKKNDAWLTFCEICTFLFFVLLIGLSIIGQL